MKGFYPVDFLGHLYAFDVAVIDLKRYNYVLAQVVRQDRSELMPLPYAVAVVYEFPAGQPDFQRILLLGAHGVDGV